MKKITTNLTLTALTLAFATLGASFAHAEDAGVAPAAAVAAPEATPENVISYNASIVSDYRYRGISQTRLQPALQGGADYTNNPTGLYLGTWLSTIKWTKDSVNSNGSHGGGDVEVDLYGGKRGEIVKDVSYDVGGLAYLYPSNGLDTNANTFELYGQVGYGPGYVKYSLATTNLFGFANSKNSGYLDIGANVEVATGLTVNLHAGHQEVKNNGSLSYNDYKVGVTKDFGIVTVSFAVIGTDASKIGYASPANGKFLGKTAAVLNVTKTF